MFHTFCLFTDKPKYWGQVLRAMLLFRRGQEEEVERRLTGRLRRRRRWAGHTPPTDQRNHSPSTHHLINCFPPPHSGLPHDRGSYQ